MTPSLAHRIREQALWAPRAQREALRELAFEAARLEETMNHIVEDAQADAVALHCMKTRGRG